MTVSEKLTAFDSPCIDCKKEHNEDWLNKNCPEGGCSLYLLFVSQRMRER